MFQSSHNRGQSNPQHDIDVDALVSELGRLAFDYRGLSDPDDREVIVKEYQRIVHSLIASGQWEEAPSFEDMLPDEHMPEEFFRYFNLR